MPPDGVVQIAFDRYLLPASITRQALTILEADDKPLSPDKAPILVYDPIARTVTLGRQDATRPWLTPGQPYKVVFALPAEADSSGVRAIDGASLAPDQALAKRGGRDFLAIEFQVAPDDADAGAAPAPAPAPGVGATSGSDGITSDLPQVSFCRDVFPIFSLKCSAPSCHGSGQTAAASLVLDSDVGIRFTALNRVAQGSNVGPVAGTPPSENPRAFGRDMPIIDVDPSRGVGSPGNSWLMYKLDLAPAPIFDREAGVRPTLTCSAPIPKGASPSYTPLAPQPRLYADDVERSILGDRIPGREMPYPAPGATDYASVALTFEEREIIRIWIQRGAPLASCGSCRIAQPSDGGSDAAATDAGADAADAGADAGDAGDAGDAADQ